MYTVYVIQSFINNNLYVGYSENFNERLKVHN
ncbi:MAG: GIY-YIG nuclease family protein, partial [Candidatus Melainabacteria bacterium]|nr:GIY-YIG nuclease family protein [Candidatus Melainabacteria bacterium]